MARPGTRIWILLGASVVALAIGGRALVRPRPGAAERGRRLAERTGCFACHGPEGTRGAGNPGRPDGAVPTFGEELMMFASSDAEIREWIADGAPAARARSTTWQERSAQGTLRMPAFKDRLTAREIDDLVEFVRAVNGTPAPEDSLALAGRDAGARLGCFGCHGAGGRLARPNPGSLKGYVPPWNGADFPELVRTRAEFDEWLRDGCSARFSNDRLARFFLDRAVLKMPAFDGHLQPGDEDALWAYVTWLREATATHSPG